MGPRQCEVCKEAQSKYKCPSCLLPYCSLLCFKRHKENPCNTTSASREEMFTMVLPKRSIEVDDTSWILDIERLKSIAESKAILDDLKDEKLQKLIYKIDSSSVPWEELDRALAGRDGLLQFTEKILSVIGPQS